MEKLEDMTLQELIQFDQEHYVLSKREFNRIFHRLYNRILYHNFSYAKYRIQLPIYQELIRLYHQVLRELLREIYKHPFDKDPLTLSILVGDYLIPKAILSYTDTFQDMNPLKEGQPINALISRHIQGLSILTGCGVCRHYNSFISDLLTEAGIISDKICCIREETNKLIDDIKCCQFSLSNHLITGYLEHNKYHLIDSFNTNYTFTKCGDFYLESNHTVAVIPNFTDTNLLFEKLHYSSNIMYESISEETVIYKKQQIEEILYQPDVQESFLNFKQSMLNIYEKISYLTTLEFNRTEESEKKKIYKNF